MSEPSLFVALRLANEAQLEVDNRVETLRSVVMANGIALKWLKKYPHQPRESSTDEQTASRYFYIPDLGRTRGACHVFIPKLDLNDMALANSMSVARSLAKSTIQVYLRIFRSNSVSLFFLVSSFLGRTCSIFFFTFCLSFNRIQLQPRAETPSGRIGWERPKNMHVPKAPRGEPIKNVSKKKPACRLEIILRRCSQKSIPEIMLA